MADTKHQIIKDLCDLLASGQGSEAAQAVTSRYAFAPPDTVARKYGDAAALRIFIRDGFLDRYSGTPLVFPGTLRIISELLPKEFPYHPHWKMSATHPAFWELSPTVDHIVPTARGGRDEEETWATTSMLHNAAKANWTVEELGWTLRPAEPRADWDGLLPWFRTYVEAHPEVLRTARIRAWWTAVSSL